MGKYLARKILFMVPAFFVVTLIGFFFSAMAPGDPVEIITGNTAMQGTMQTNRSSSAIKDSVRNELGLNLPLFYFSFGTAADPVDLYKVKWPDQRYAMKYLSRKYGMPERVKDYFKRIDIHSECLDPDYIDKYIQVRIVGELKGKEPDSVIQVIVQSKQPDSAKWAIERATPIVRNLRGYYNEDLIKRTLDSLEKLYRCSPLLPIGSIKEIRKSFNLITYGPSKGTMVPALTWHGSNNQYHRWLGNLFNGHFGYSYVDGQPVHTKIWEKFFRSFLLILLSVILAYVVSIPAGVYSARYKNRWPDKTFGWFSFILFSLPSYFVGTMLLLLFANNSYFAWFPESGYCDPETYNATAPWISRLWQQLPFMVLPVITYTYGSFAFISRLVRSSVLENLNADYIRTARAKGLSEKQVIWKHALRNSYLPIITMFVNILPAAIGGSVIVESIFSYPGMGLESVGAVHHADHPMLISIVVFAGFMTMIAYFIADILYLWADPRIAYDKK